MRSRAPALIKIKNEIESYLWYCILASGCCPSIWFTLEDKVSADIRSLTSADVIVRINQNQRHVNSHKKILKSYQFSKSFEKLHPVPVHYKFFSLFNRIKIQLYHSAAVTCHSHITTDHTFQSEYPPEKKDQKRINIK